MSLEQQAVGAPDAAGELPPIPETRAARYRIGPGATPDSIGEDFARLSEHGFNTVVVTAFAQGYTCFPCRSLARAGMPEIHPAFRRRRLFRRRAARRMADPLAVAIEAAEEAGLRALGHIEVLHVASAGRDAPGPILGHRPQWAIRRRSWLRRLPPGPDAHRYFINPANEDARRLLGDVLNELVEGYPLAGVFLNDLRYPRELISPQQSRRARDCDAFLEDKGAPRRALKFQAGDPLFREWQAWRNERLNELLRYLHARMQCASTRVWIVSQAVGPYVDEVFRGALQGDWAHWLAQEFIDAVAPFYKNCHGEEFRQALQADAQRAPDCCALYPLLDASDLRGGAPRLQICREAATAGFIFREFGEFEEKDWRIARELFARPARPTEESLYLSARRAMEESRRIVARQAELAEFLGDMLRILPPRPGPRGAALEPRVATTIADNLRGLEQQAASGGLALAPDERIVTRWLNLARRCLLLALRH